MAMPPMELQMTGMIQARAVAQPEVGSQWSFTEKRSISSRPSQNCGMEMKIIAKIKSP